MLRKQNGIKKVWQATALVSVLFCAGEAKGWAQSLRQVTYLGGTALKESGLHGSVSIAEPDTLVFEGTSRLTIPYDRVLTYESSCHKQIHLGLLTEGLWRLAAPWPETKRLSLSYRDATEQTQVILLEMSQGDEALLVEVLKARVPRGGGRPIPLAKPTVAKE